MECDDCGSRNVTRREIEGHLLEECNLCGHRQGDDATVALLDEMEAGRERGLDDHVIPLVSVLESAGVFRVVQASGGEPARIEWPYVFFALTRNDTRYIERLLRSIELANRETRMRWLIELSLQKEIIYILRPRFWKSPADITADEILNARADMGVVARNLRRDLSLSWWKSS